MKPATSIYRKGQRPRYLQAFGWEEERRQSNRNAEPEVKSFIDYYTSLADTALREPRQSKLVDYYVELADIYLRPPRRLGN